MPKKTRKRFVDKKNSVTFHVVHRSQHDPLITDETAPQRVLVESGNTQNKQPTTDNLDKRKTQQQKFGVFFDDDYDYLQHLREPGRDVVEWERVEEQPTQKKDKEKHTKSQVQLPSSVFASEFEEEEGLLRKAAPRFGPRPDWDPDIVEALDDDFNFDDPDNALEDNFMELAMDGDGDSDEEEDEDSYIDSDDLGGVSDIEEGDEENDKIAPLPFRERRFSDVETKSRFTEYSMSSSVIRRNAQLTLLDDRFEKFFDQYDDAEIGPLDMENIDGHIDLQDEMLVRYAEQFQKDKEIEHYDKNWDAVRLTKLQRISSQEDLVEIEVDDGKKEKWDCESILSTYSNIYNHPKLIDEPRRKNKTIKINPKTGVPMDTLEGGNMRLTEKLVSKLNRENEIKDLPEGQKSVCAQSVMSALSILSIRPKDETPEEKKERKRLLRDYRQERRIERKANTDAFTREKIKQEKMKANNMVNIQGSKIV